MNSVNSELRGQIEVLSSPSRDTSARGITPAMSTMTSEGGDDRVAGDDEDAEEEDTTTLSGTSSRLSTNVDEKVDTANNNDANAKDSYNKFAMSDKTQRKSILQCSQFIGIFINCRFVADMAVPMLSRDVASMKLEQKFFDAMNRIAELLAEKEQLEHLTIQLQEETETVGKEENDRRYVLLKKRECDIF